MVVSQFGTHLGAGRGPAVFEEELPDPITFFSAEQRLPFEADPTGSLGTPAGIGPQIGPQTGTHLEAGRSPAAFVGALPARITLMENDVFKTKHFESKGCGAPSMCRAAVVLENL